MIRNIISLAVVPLLFSQVCWASPTGLNNIPTTDVAGHKVLVLQSWLTTGNDAKPVWVTGFKQGILDKIEVGADGKVGSGDEGPVALQAKAKLIDLDSGFAGLVGIEGITFEGNIDKDMVPYLTVSQDIRLNDDFQIVRLHGGYSFQDDNLSMFTGADRTFEVFDQDLVLRSDLKQVNDGNNLLISGGFLLTLPFNVVLESWLNIPTESGKEESVTIKLNYVFNF